MSPLRENKVNRRDDFCHREFNDFVGGSSERNCS
jgi:hypothetical protein